MAVDQGDWRRDGNDGLRNTRWFWSTWKAPRPDWDHEHCEFCMAKFSETMPDTLREGYCMLGTDRWICADCFADFKAEFKLRRS